MGAQLYVAPVAPRTTEVQDRSTPSGTISSLSPHLRSRSPRVGLGHHTTCTRMGCDDHTCSSDSVGSGGLASPAPHLLAVPPWPRAPPWNRAIPCDHSGPATPMMCTPPIVSLHGPLPPMRSRAPTESCDLAGSGDRPRALWRPCRFLRPRTTVMMASVSGQLPDGLSCGPPRGSGDKLPDDPGALAPSSKMTACDKLAHSWFTNGNADAQAEVTGPDGDPSTQSLRMRVRARAGRRSLLRV